MQADTNYAFNSRLFLLCVEFYHDLSIFISYLYGIKNLIIYIFANMDQPKL